MILRPYHPFLARLTRAFMFPDNATGGGGDGGAGGAAPAGGDGGGGAAAAPPDGAPPIDPDLVSFEAPDITAALGDITGKKPDPAPVPPKTPAAPKAPDPKPPTEPPAAQLRKEYDALKQQLAAAEEKLKVGDPRIKALEDKLAAKESEFSASQKAIADYEKKLAMADPRVTAPLRKLETDYDAKAGKFYTRVPDLDTGRVNQLLGEYVKLPFGKPEYREARADFEKKVNEALGGTEDREHRKLNDALGFIEDTFDFYKERNTLNAEVDKNALNLAREGARADYQGKVEFTRETITAVKALPAVLEKSNPFHPIVTISKFLEAVGPDEAKKLTEGLEEAAEAAEAGIAPRRDEDLANLSAEQRREQMEADAQADVRTRKQRVVAQYYGGIMFRAFPSLYKDWLRLKERESKEVLPPDPTGGNGNGNPNTDDLASFAAPPIPENF